MKYYFILQVRLIHRQLIDFGIRPELGYVLGGLAFIGFSFALFLQMEYAASFYALIALFYVSRIGTQERNDLLKQCFSKRQFQILRLVENWIISLPFVIFMVIMEEWFYGAFTLGAALLVSFFPSRALGSFSIPSPFSRHPFEFSVGFRKTWLLILGAYVLLYVSIDIGNFNLGIGSMLLTALVTYTYYSEPENQIYVWVHNLSPGAFLIRKSTRALVHLSMITIPGYIVLVVFNPEYLTLALVLLGMSLIFMIAVVLSKYSAFPNKINVPQAVMLMISVWFPPLLLFVIPYFYKQSVKHLTPLL